MKKRIVMLGIVLFCSLIAVGCNGGGGQEEPIDPEQQMYEDMQNNREVPNEPNWDNREPFSGDTNKNRSRVEEVERPYNDADVDTVKERTFNQAD